MNWAMWGKMIKTGHGNETFLMEFPVRTEQGEYDAKRNRCRRLWDCVNPNKEADENESIQSLTRRYEILDRRNLLWMIAEAGRRCRPFHLCDKPYDGPPVSAMADVGGGKEFVEPEDESEEEEVESEVEEEAEVVNEDEEMKEEMDNGEKEVVEVNGKGEPVRHWQTVTLSVEVEIGDVEEGASQLEQAAIELFTKKRKRAIEDRNVLIKEAELKITQAQAGLTHKKNTLRFSEGKSTKIG
jgi:hypothetical protein